MPSRAIVVVAGGTSSRLGTDKLMVDVEGEPLIAWTLRSISDAADRCVVACRTDLMRSVSDLGFDVDVVSGGSTRTNSELAGLEALGASYDLIGIHDGARPMIARSLIETLFEAAERVGGAIPVLDSTHMIVNRHDLQPIKGVVRAQTPQVFRGPELVAAYQMAAKSSFQGHDTAEVVEEFSDLEVLAVAGDPANLKVTLPADLERVRELVRIASRNDAL